MAHVSRTPAFDATAAEGIAVRVLQGDEAAFPLLIERLWPEWLSLVESSRSMGALGRSADDARNVVTRLVGKLKADDYRALRSYAPWRERHPDKSFHDWLRILAANAVRDYVREKRGSTRPPPNGEEGEGSAKRLLNDFVATLPPDELGARPPMTAAQTARELLEFAERQLPPLQLACLKEWLEGATFDDMASSLAIADAAEAKRLVRAAIAVVRRQFLE